MTDKNPLADNLYPNANAELGGGVQVTYHRRPVIAPEDVISLAFVKLGSGANMLGYYMFHGGLNPEGKTLDHAGIAGHQISQRLPDNQLRFSGAAGRVGAGARVLLSVSADALFHQ